MKDIKKKNCIYLKKNNKKNSQLIVIFFIVFVVWGFLLGMFLHTTNLSCVVFTQALKQHISAL